MKLMVFIFLLLSFSSVHCEEKLPVANVITDFVPTTKDAFATSFSREALPAWGVIIGSTGVLYYYDEQILSEVQKKGRQWGVGNQDSTKAAISMNGQELLRLPSDTGSAMYFLGDGWTHITIALGFAGYGQLSDNTRAFNTGLMLFHGMFVSTVFNQALKRSFGRESPEVKTSERGSWNLFPSFKEYNSRTASYDAMPTGHLMTATLTFTIITERYPEYNSFMYPFAGVWLTALGLQMINNGVHWASDYPLGIAMGYVFGKAATHMVGRVEDKSKTKAEIETSWLFIPSFANGGSMIKAVKAF